MYISKKLSFFFWNYGKSKIQTDLVVLHRLHGQNLSNTHMLNTCDCCYYNVLNANTSGTDQTVQAILCLYHSGFLTMCIM